MDFVNFYKRFINKFNTIAVFFTDMLKKSKKKIWKILNLRQRRDKRLII